MFPISLHLACPNTIKHYPTDTQTNSCAHILLSVRKLTLGIAIAKWSALDQFEKRPRDPCKSSTASFQPCFLPSAKILEHIDLDLLWSDEIKRQHEEPMLFTRPQTHSLNDIWLCGGRKLPSTTLSDRDLIVLPAGIMQTVKYNESQRCQVSHQTSRNVFGEK